MIDLRTSPSLLRGLQMAAQRKPTAEEVQKQRLSFIMSAVNESGEVTESRIKEVLAEQEGGVRS